MYAGTAGSSASTTSGADRSPGVNDGLHLHLWRGAGGRGGRRRAAARRGRRMRVALGLVAADQALALAATAGGRVGQVDLAGVAPRSVDGRRARPALVGSRRRSAMIGVPTGTVSPSGTSRAVTVPAYGDGSSTSDLAVSISTTMSLTVMTSPTFTFQVTISASVRPSPTSGSLYS